MLYKKKVVGRKVALNNKRKTIPGTCYKKQGNIGYQNKQ